MRRTGNPQRRGESSWPGDASRTLASGGVGTRMYRLRRSDRPDAVTEGTAQRAARGPPAAQAGSRTPTLVAFILRSALWIPPTLLVTSVLPSGKRPIQIRRPPHSRKGVSLYGRRAIRSAEVKATGQETPAGRWRQAGSVQGCTVSAGPTGQML